jgi:hypothetical protein
MSNRQDEREGPGRSGPESGRSVLGMKGSKI